VAVPHVAHGRIGVIVHRIVYATFTTMAVFGVMHATVFGTSMVRTNVGAVATN